MRSRLRLFAITSLMCASVTWLTGCGNAGSDKTKFDPPASSYEQKFFGISDGAMEMRVKGAAITSSFFEGATAQAQLGRLFVKDDFNASSGHVALMSSGFWATHFKSDPAMIGKSLALDGTNYTVVGILPATFNVPVGAEIWIPKK